MILNMITYINLQVWKNIFLKGIQNVLNICNIFRLSLLIQII